MLTKKHEECWICSKHIYSLIFFKSVSPSFVNLEQKEYAMVKFLDFVMSIDKEKQAFIDDLLEMNRTLKVAEKEYANFISKRWEN
jgi:hypothetical protein